MKNREKYIENIELDLDLEIMEMRLAEAKQQQNELLTKGKEFREKKLLQYYEVELKNDMEKEKGRRNKVLRSIKKVK